MEEENKNEEIKNEEIKNEEPKQKSNKVFVIVIIIIAMALTFGCGIILGQKLFEGNKENKNTSKEEKNENNKTEQVSFKDIKNDLVNGVVIDNVISIKVDKSVDYTIIEDISINNKKIIESDPFNEIGEIFKIENNYLITTHGTDINTTHYYLYDNKGNLLQEIYELEENNMVIATSDSKYERTINGNIIELNGTRMTHGPSLVKGNKDYYICDKDELSKANVGDDYIVEAKYQLIYNSNKFEIKRISGTEKTLGYYKDENCTEEDINYIDELEKMRTTLINDLKNNKYYAYVIKCSEVGNGETKNEYIEVSSKAVDTIINKLKTSTKIEKGTPVGYVGECTPKKVEFMITNTKKSFEGKKFLVMYGYTGENYDKLKIDVGYADEPYSFYFENDKDIENLLESLS